MYNEKIRDFVKFIEEVKTTYKISLNTYGTKNDERNDLLHELEFCDSKNSRKVISKLRRVLKERRVAKNTIEELKPFIDYIDNNKQAMNRLTDALGTVRMMEKKHDNSMYSHRVRTDLTIEHKHY